MLDREFAIRLEAYLSQPLLRAGVENKVSRRKSIIGLLEKFPFAAAIATVATPKHDRSKLHRRNSDRERFDNRPWNVYTMFNLKTDTILTSPATRDRDERSTRSVYVLQYARNVYRKSSISIRETFNTFVET